MSRADRILAAAAGGALILAIAAGFVLFAPTDDSQPIEGTGLLIGTPGASGELPDAVASAMPSTIVVDVAGSVARPGVHELPSGARIGDAIAAAGGYAPDADLEAAATAINLAQPLTDGEQIRVPRIGEGAAAVAGTGASPAAPAPGGAGAGSSGIVNLNTATPEQLEALPGIGPVTVQKIVAARQEQPFSSLDDAVQRKVIDRGQLEGIQGLATAG